MSLAQLPQAVQLTPTPCTWHSYLRQCSLHLNNVPGTVTSENATYTYIMYMVQQQHSYLRQCNLYLHYVSGTATAQLPQAMQLIPTLCTWYSNSTVTSGNATYSYTMYLVQQQHSYLRQCNLFLHYVPGTATAQLPQAMQLIPTLCTWHSNNMGTSGCSFAITLGTKDSGCIKYATLGATDI